VALTGNPPAAGSVPALVWQNAAARGGETILRRKYRGIWQAESWAELAAAARQIGMALRGDGMQPGDVVAVLSETRPEWVWVDLAILGGGGISAGIDPSGETERVADALATLGCTQVFVENEEQLDTVLAAREACPALRRIIIFDMKGLRELTDPMCESLAALRARGAAEDAREPGAWDAAIAAVAADLPATILTSSDGFVQLRHDEIIRLTGDATARLAPRAGDERVAFLPMCGAAERILGLYCSLASRCVSNYLESADTLTENLQEVQPTVLGATPMVWEQMRARIAARAAGATWLQRQLYRWAITLGERAAALRSTGGSPSAGLALLAWLGRIAVLRNVRQELGLSRLRVAYTADAPLDSGLRNWVLALGIDLMEIADPLEGFPCAAMPRRSLAAVMSGGT
jgi:long-chain acyl-CoA synthetase